MLAWGTPVTMENLCLVWVSHQYIAGEIPLKFGSVPPIWHIWLWIKTLDTLK